MLIMKKIIIAICLFCIFSGKSVAETNYTRVVFFEINDVNDSFGNCSIETNSKLNYPNYFNIPKTYTDYDFLFIYDDVNYISTYYFYDNGGIANISGRGLKIFKGKYQGIDYLTASAIDAPGLYFDGKAGLRRGTYIIYSNLITQPHCLEGPAGYPRTWSASSSGYAIVDECSWGAKDNCDALLFYACLKKDEYINFFHFAKYPDDYLCIIDWWLEDPIERNCE